jgi:hypothetical protein
VLDHQRLLRPIVLECVSVVAACALLAPLAHGDEAAAIAGLKSAGAKITETKGVATGCEIADCSPEKFPAAEWEKLAQLSQLKSLSFGSGLTDEMLAKLPPFPALENFSTNAMRVTDDGLKPLARYTKLRSIAFFHPPKEFTGTGLVHLAPLADLDRLTVAGSLAFGDEGMAAVGELKQLKTFRTWHAGGTDAGVRKLAGLTRLENLVLGQRLTYKPPACPSDETIGLLVELKSLKSLDLQEARLSSGALARLKELPQLKTLKLSGVELSAEDLEGVKKGLAGIEVTWTEPNEVYLKRIKALFGAK